MPVVCCSLYFIKAPEVWLRHALRAWACVLLSECYHCVVGSWVRSIVTALKLMVPQNRGDLFLHVCMGIDGQTTISQHEAAG